MNNVSNDCEIEYRTSQLCVDSATKIIAMIVRVTNNIWINNQTIRHFVVAQIQRCIHQVDQTLR